MQELITNIVKKLVDSPDEVEVSEAQAEKTVVYEIKVNKDDLGKVIGRSGRIIGAIRTIAKAASAKSDKKVIVEILD